MENTYLLVKNLPILLNDLKDYPKPYNIEIGCGEDYLRPLEKWIHSDCCLNRNLINNHHLEMLCYSWDIPLAGNSVGEIFAKGFWEHLSYLEAEKTMVEWIRILIKNGIVRFNFPPIDHAIHMYKSKQVDFLWLMRAIYGWQRQENDIHCSGWTEEGITAFIQKFTEFKIEEIFWADSQIMDEKPNRIIGDPYSNPGAHLWVTLRRN